MSNIFIRKFRKLIFYFAHAKKTRVTWLILYFSCLLFFRTSTKILKSWVLYLVDNIFLKIGLSIWNCRFHKASWYSFQNLIFGLGNIFYWRMLRFFRGLWRVFYWLLIWRIFCSRRIYFLFVSIFRDLPTPEPWLWYLIRLWAICSWDSCR